MNDIISCDFDYVITKENNPPAKTICILQPVSGDGNLKAHEKTYSLVEGSLYFINNAINYEINAVSNHYKQNKVIISQDYIKNLSDLLEFDKETNQIFFENNITIVPLKNYKSIVSRFKRINNSMQKDEPYTKARITTDLLALINYAVYSIYHS